MAQKQVIMKHGRTEEQKRVMQRIERDGVDPFDWDLIPEYHYSPVLRKGTYWLITPNDYPYEGTLLHLLLIYRDAVRSPTGTAPEAWTELREHIVWIEEEFSVKGGSLLMRFGDPLLTGASVGHLHLHVIVGGTGRRKIKASVGYSAE